MKNFSELTLEQQQLLRDSIHMYLVQYDPKTSQPYVRFMGENVEYNSILNHQVLLG